MAWRVTAARAVLSSQDCVLFCRMSRRLWIRAKLHGFYRMVDVIMGSERQWVGIETNGTPPEKPPCRVRRLPIKLITVIENRLARTISYPRSFFPVAARRNTVCPTVS